MLLKKSCYFPYIGGLQPGGPGASLSAGRLPSCTLLVGLRPWVGVPPFPHLGAGLCQLMLQGSTSKLELSLSAATSN